MRDRESKKQALLELIKKDPEAVVELLLDLMERVEFLEQKLALNRAYPRIRDFENELDLQSLNFLNCTRFEPCCVFQTHLDSKY